MKRTYHLTVLQIYLWWKKKKLTSRTDLAVIISLRYCEMYNSSPGIFGKLFFDSLRSSNLKWSTVRLSVLSHQIECKIISIPELHITHLQVFQVKRKACKCFKITLQHRINLCTLPLQFTSWLIWTLVGGGPHCIQP